MTQTPIDSLSGSIRAGLTCVCPRCGRGKLFQGFLTPRPQCDVCGLDYGFADSGDGPAVFIMFLAGFIVVGAALMTEVIYKPPFWVHAALWLPLILIVTLAPLRPMKGLMIALQYHHKAAEGRFGGEGALNADARNRRPWRGLLVPVVLLFAVLVDLGSWQIQRKTWKEGLIATLNELLAAPPSALPAPSAWPSLDQASDEYRRVRFTAEFDQNREALVYAAASAFRPDASGPGYWVFTPARLAGNRVVVVNRGFVPEGRREVATRAVGEIRGPVEIVGVMRWPESRSWFSPADDPHNNLWFTRDPLAIAAAKGLPAVAPFYVEQESPEPPGGLPRPGKIVANLRNEHLQYALTWFGLALVLAVAFGVWAFGSGAADTPRQP